MPMEHPQDPAGRPCSRTLLIKLPAATAGTPGCSWAAGCSTPAPTASSSCDFLHQVKDDEAGSAERPRARRSCRRSLGGRQRMVVYVSAKGQNEHTSGIHRYRHLYLYAECRTHNDRIRELRTWRSRSRGAAVSDKATAGSLVKGADQGGRRHDERQGDPVFR